MPLISKDMEIKKGFFQKLGDKFTLRIANDEKDELNKLLDLNTTVHGELIREYIEHLYLNHPKKNEMLWFYIENNESNQSISGITLMPLIWKIGGISIPICEMGLVSTLEKYRGMGFIKKMNELYERSMSERGYIMSVIRGIPYYYRRFDYEFAVPLDVRIHLSADKVPLDDLNYILIRKATSKDIAFIKEQYNSFYSQFYIINSFNEEGFIYRFLNDKFDENILSTYILEDHGQSVAYFSIGKSFDNKAFTIITPHLSNLQMIKVLQYVKELNEKSDNSIIPLHVRYDVDFGKFIIQLGGITHQSYGWQIKIMNLKLFFELIKPIIESRIQNSEFKELTRNVVISNYNENIELIFKKGKIIKINMKMGYPDENECDIRIPGALLNKLILSDKTIDEINYIIDDAIVNPSSKMLINVLFPKKISYPDTYY
jgi:hypothetical protein